MCEHIESRANWLVNEWGCDVTLRERNTTPPVENEEENIENLPSVDMMPDWQEPPIQELPFENAQTSPQKQSFIEWLIALIKSIIDAIISLFK